jgi:hypothetical protein
MRHVEVIRNITNYMVQKCITKYNDYDTSERREIEKLAKKLNLLIINI